MKKLALLCILGILVSCQNNDNNIHPFRMKSGYQPAMMNNPIQNYIDKTKLELSSMEIRKTTDNLSALERKALNTLKGRKDIIIKNCPNNEICSINKENRINVKTKSFSEASFLPINSPTPSKYFSPNIYTIWPINIPIPARPNPQCHP